MTKNTSEATFIIGLSPLRESVLLSSAHD
jgi:hypothetical protein